MTRYMDRPHSLLWAAGHGPTSFMQLSMGQHLPHSWSTEWREVACPMPVGISSLCLICHAPSTSQLCHEATAHGLPVQQKLGKKKKNRLRKPVTIGKNMREAKEWDASSLLGAGLSWPGCRWNEWRSGWYNKPFKKSSLLCFSLSFLSHISLVSFLRADSLSHQAALRGGTGLSDPLPVPYWQAFIQTLL